MKRDFPYLSTTQKTKNRKIKKHQQSTRLVYYTPLTETLCESEQSEKEQSEKEQSEQV